MGVPVLSMDKVEALDHFKEMVRDELIKIHQERHDLILQACDIWEAVSKYEDDLKVNGFNWIGFERFYNRPLTSIEAHFDIKSELNILEDKEREKLLIRNMKRLVYIWGMRIPKLNRRTLELELLSEMDYFAYNKIREAINRYFTICVLKGDIMNMGNYLGQHVVRYYEYPKERKVLDKGMTFKYIKELKARGETLYSAKNPDGKPYRIYFDSNGFYIWQWLKSYRIHNQRFYSFKTFNSALDESKKKEYANCKDVDKILNSELSVFRRMLLLAMNTEMKQRYEWNGTLFNKEKSKEYDLEGDRKTRFEKFGETDYSHLIDEDNPYGI